MTSKERVQLEPAAMLAPARTIEVPPAVRVGVPPQLLTTPVGVEMTRPFGSVSTTPTPVRATVLLGFVNWKDKTTFWLSTVVVGLKVSSSVGGPTTIVESVPELAEAPPPLTATLLEYVPTSVPLTLTVRVIAGNEELVASTVLLVQVK